MIFFAHGERPAIELKDDIKPRVGEWRVFALAMSEVIDDVAIRWVAHPTLHGVPHPPDIDYTRIKYEGTKGRHSIVAGLYGDLDTVVAVSRFDGKPTSNVFVDWEMDLITVIDPPYPQEDEGNTLRSIP